MPICPRPAQPVVQFIIDTAQNLTQLTLKRQGLALLLAELGRFLSRNLVHATAPQFKA